MNKKLYLSITTTLAVLFSLFDANAISFKKVTCDEVPPSGTGIYDVQVSCSAEILRTGGTGNWFNAAGQYCPSFCASIGQINAPSPDGFSCASGEERPPSAMGKIDYSPTGCWPTCATPGGPSGAISIGDRCYAPGQKRDNDRTDITVGCYCVGGDAVAHTIELGMHTRGSASVSGVAVTPGGWQRVDKSLINDMPGRIFDVVGGITVNTTGSLSMVVRVQGQCGTSAMITGIASTNNTNVNSDDYELKLPSCSATPLPAATATPVSTAQCGDQIDNDGDGRVDKLVELNPNNGELIRVGGLGNPEVVTQAVREAIAAKKLRLTLPMPGRGSQIMRADHPTRARHSDEGGTLHLPTLEKVCNVLGFKTYVSSTCRANDGTGSCTYYSPGNNEMWRFVNGDFQAQSAEYKTWIASITCKDRLAACADGWDNDGDGLVDRADPGCASDNDTSEGAHDPKCDTSNGAAEGEQCRNKIDDDNDGLVDSTDPGCWSKPSDPQSYDPNRDDESSGTSQCQDGKDNDSDGAADMSDFSCSTPLDNDETNLKSKCQNGLDDDSDGLIDTQDGGCSSAQDNTEDDESARLTLGAECKTKNVDGTTTAYFSYNNTTGGDLSLKTDSTLGTLNELTGKSSSGAPLVAPTSFKAGLLKGGIAITFTGQSISWSVRAQKSAVSLATISETTPFCAAIQPLAECRTFVNGRSRVRLGYRNDNAFEQQFAIGQLNGFSPGSVDRAQPTRFFAGLNKSVFEVDLINNSTGQAMSSLVWTVNGISTVLDEKLPVCADFCSSTPVGTINTKLDGVADQLTQLMKKAVKILESARVEFETSTGQNTEKIARARTDALRATKKAERYLADFQDSLLKFPSVVRTCPEAPPACVTVDNGVTIDRLRGLYAAVRNSIKRTIARAYFRNTGKTNRDDKLVKQAKSLEAEGRATLATLPRFSTECK